MPPGQPESQKGENYQNQASRRRLPYGQMMLRKRVKNGEVRGPEHLTQIAHVGHQGVG